MFESLLPKELKTLINQLQSILNIKENSKEIIDQVIHKERKNVCCPNCKSINIKKNENIKIGNCINAKIAIRNLTN